MIAVTTTYGDITLNGCPLPADPVLLVPVVTGKAVPPETPRVFVLRCV
jgi:hypothetical protein